MILQQLEVSGLFGRFDHHLTFPPEERVAIMIAPNGFGKTMILRMVNTLFAEPPIRLARMPFMQLTLTFDDGSRVEVNRDARSPGDDEPRFRLELRHYSASGEPSEPYHPGPAVTEAELGFPVGMIEDILPILDQTARRQWRNRATGETLSIEDVLERFGHELPIEGHPGPKTPRWLSDLREAIPVRLIDTERLIKARTLRKPRQRTHPHREERTVRRYSSALGARIRETLSQYGTLSQSLDRTFPARLVAGDPVEQGSLESLRDALAEVEGKRRELVEAGLLVQDEPWPGGIQIPEVGQIEEAHRPVLAVYVRDAREKLGVFDDLLARVDTLKRIVNQRFLQKQLTIGPDGISVVSEDGGSLELEMLSSGEQHELVLLYDLLFMVKPGSLILIDEPEISLHVAWQEKFLGDIQEVAQLSAFRVLMATHSPQIIGDRFDLTVELSPSH